MGYKYVLIMDPQQNYRIGDLIRYLQEHKLISGKTENGISDDMKELYTIVTVPNKEKFLDYYHRKPETRQLDPDNDPGDIIKNCEAWRNGHVTGQASPTSMEGMIAAARKRNYRKDKRILEKTATSKVENPINQKGEIRSALAKIKKEKPKK